MRDFKFELNQSVKLLMSDENGLIKGRAENVGAENQYRVIYKAGDNRQVTSWWDESEIIAVEQPVDTPAQAPAVVYNFGSFHHFELDAAKAGDVASAFAWLDTPQGIDFWDDLAREMTPEGQSVLDDMIAQYEVYAAGNPTQKKLKLELGKYYEDRGGGKHGPLISNGLEVFPFTAGGKSWKVDGSAWSGLDVDEDDLIKEVAAPEQEPTPKPKKLKLEAGKSYLDRDGCPWGPMIAAGSKFKHHTDDDAEWGKRGKCKNQSTDWDLISEVTS